MAVLEQLYTELKRGTVIQIRQGKNLPRKLLNYRTPLDVFLEEVNKIVDLDTVQFHIAIKKEYSLNKEQFSDLVQFRKNYENYYGIEVER